MKTNIQKINIWCEPVKSIYHKVKIFGAQTNVINAKTYPNFERIHQFLHDLKPKQIFRSTDRQILNSRMATKLTIIPKWKGHLLNQRKPILVNRPKQKLMGMFMVI